jgi:hypothetical protein
MAAHLDEAPVERPFLAQEHRLHRRFHIVVDAPPAAAPEEGERPVVRVEHHLLALARISPHEQHPAMAQPDMRHLHRHGRAVQHHHLVAPIKLERLARCEAQRHVARRRRAVERLSPLPGIAPDSVVAARVAEIAQRLEHPHQRQPLPSRLRLVRRQQTVEIGAPGPQLRPRLDITLVAR